MIVTHRLSMNLDRMEQGLQVDAVQNDCNARCLQLTLLEDGQPWYIPDGTVVTVHYSRPDGSGGEYDTLSSGEPAWSCSENQVTVVLVPQICSVPGLVQCILELRNDQVLLHTFGVKLLVQPNPSGEELSGGDYSNVGSFLPSPPHAQVGDFIQVVEVNNYGQITVTEAVSLHQIGLPAPESAAVGQCIIVKAVDDDGLVTETAAADRFRLPEVTEADNGLVLGVVDGTWDLMEVSAGEVLEDAEGVAF